jgi:hypothetical protein
MESIEFMHANQVFVITFEEDLSFAEVRAILDHLLGSNAFHPDVQNAHGVHNIAVDEAQFKVWVAEIEVIVQRVGSM